MICNSDATSRGRRTLHRVFTYELLIWGLGVETSLTQHAECVRHHDRQAFRQGVVDNVQHVSAKARIHYMARESVQKKIGRVRPPRVHITYDVETGGAIEKKELPFVVGVMADLSGNPEKPLPPVKQRKFVEIDRDNFDAVLAKAAPRLTYKVDNTLTEEDTLLGIDLRFSSLDDFEPERVARQIEPLRKLLETRAKLANLRSSIAGNDKLEALLQEVAQNTSAMNKLRSEMGMAEPEEQDRES
jgi:type VI secretion system protein ImpB